MGGYGTMSLSEDIVSQYLEVNVEEKAKKEETLLGTIVSYNGKQYVKLDGSDIYTPAFVTTNINIEQPVMVKIKNHSAYVVGNTTPMQDTSNDNNILNSTMKYSISTIPKEDIESLWN